MLAQVQFEMFVASLAENFLRLNYFRRQTVTVAHTLRAGASLNKLWRDSELAKVSLLFDCVSSEHFEEFRHCGFRQSLDVVVTGEDRSSPLAQTAFELWFVLFFVESLPLNGNFQATL